jgi:hypothetical protein
MPLTAGGDTVIEMNNRRQKMTEQKKQPQLIQWEAQGGCEAACPHGCWVEPDGHCPHGKPSWLIVMGLI